MLPTDVRSRLLISALALLAIPPANGIAGAALLAIRGSAVVHLRPDSENLCVRILKRDLNIYDGEDTLAVRLLAPDRTVAAAVTMPDDGNAKRGGGMAKERQAAELNATVTQPGVYHLHVIPQGGDQVFGFETNCKRYMIDGPMFLNDASLSGDVCFEPPKGEFIVTAEAVHRPGLQKIPLYDGEGKLVHTLDLAEVTKPVSYAVPASWPRSGKPWLLHVARQDVRLTIKGVRFWSPVAESFFPVGKTRWMLTPYSIKVYLLPGAGRELAFDLRNSSGVGDRLTVLVDSAEPVSCELLTPNKPVHLKPGQSSQVKVRLHVDQQAQVGAGATCVLKAAYASDPSSIASATIRVHVGRSPVSQTLKMPIVLRLYEHENAQFGYAPFYPCNAAFFDLKNRPYIRTRTGDRDFTTGVQTLAAGTWIEKSFITAIRAKYPSFVGTYRAAGWHGTKTVFDAQNHMYTLLQVALADRRRPWVLLYSLDAGDRFHVYELPTGTPDIEQWTGHNMASAPPPITLYTFTADHPGRWASVHDLQLLLPRKQGEGLSLGKAVLVSKRCFGTCQHSGGPAASVTRGDRTHVVWGEVDDTGAPGVPTYVATYDHRTGILGQKVLLAHAPPVNDVHNAPGICMDSDGYLHVITGAHGAPFKYMRSLKPNDAYSGWTKPEDVLKTGSVNPKSGKQEGRQTYLSLVCDRKDTLHIAYRQWRSGVDPYFKGGLYAALSYQRKPKGRAWGQAKPLVVPPLPSYSVYYHKLTIDRQDRLYLSYSYYSSNLSYRDELPGQYDYRAVITSGDGGTTWKLAETADFAAGVADAVPGD